MQGLAITTNLRVSHTFIPPRIQSSCPSKHLKPTIVCFSSFGSFPNSGLLLSGSSSSQKPIVPLLGISSSSSSSSLSSVLENLNPAVKKRVEVLVEIENQLEETKAKFVEERAALEAKYQKLYEPLFTKRCEIVNGEGVGEEKRGVPDFWLTVLKNNEVTGEDITERDEGALKYLKDIRWSNILGEKEYEKGFRLEFYFDEKNPYFKNTVLTKEYYIQDEYVSRIHWRTWGTRIEWYPGNSLDPKNATKTQDFENFFSFFSEPRYATWNLGHSDEELELTDHDFSVGSTIKHETISHAVSWFTAAGVVLSQTVGKCVEVLREIQKQHDELEAKYIGEREALEAKYRKLYQPLYTKRYEIVSGVVELEGAPEEVKSAQGEDKSAKEKGVPDFWLRALKSTEYIYRQINERDEGALKYLKDIRWSRIEEASNWKIEFYFDKNPYFKNTVLTKTYHIIDGSFYNVFDKAIGTEIEWYPGNCLTANPIRTTEEEKEEDFVSFFDFFSSPPGYDFEKDQMQLELDFALEYRHSIIPCAVSLFLEDDVPVYDDYTSSDETDWEDYDDGDDYWEEIFSKSTSISSDATGL